MLEMWLKWSNGRILTEGGQTVRDMAEGGQTAGDLAEGGQTARYLSEGGKTAKGLKVVQLLSKVDQTTR